MSWATKTLGDIAIEADGEIRTGPFGSQLHKHDYVEAETATPVVMPKDMVGGRIDTSSIARIDDVTRERLSAHILRSGDIVLGRRGEIGRRAWVSDHESGWLCGTGSMRISIRDSHEVVPRFLYYFLELPSTVGWLQGHSVGATMSNLSAGVVQQLPVAYPSVDAQRMIVSALDALEKLIENNQQRVEILEEAARLLYRQWFVHFRFPGHDGVELIGSDLGRIPEGWQCMTLGAAAKWLSGGTPRTSVPEYWDGDIPWITSGSLKNFLINSSKRRLTPLGVSNGSKIVERDTTVFVVRGMSLASEFRHGIAEVPLAFGQDCKALVAESGIEPLYLALSVSSLADEILGMVEYAAHGTGKLSTDRLQALMIPRPPVLIQRQFVAMVGPLRELMSNLNMQNELLHKARDLLLPRLVSGEIEVSDLDLELEAVGV